MPRSWTAEQVLGLAPDTASAKAAQGLASPHRWQTLGATDGAVWGTCVGSAQEPYQTEIDLNQPSFKCTCPSRKRPCKHTLGLFLLYAKQAGAFRENVLPAWVAEWLADNGRKASKRQATKRAADPSSDPPPEPSSDSTASAGASADPPPSPVPQPDETARTKRARDQAKRAAQREDRVNAGVDELQRWLFDLARQGLAAAQSKPAHFWEHMAARMVDAQAPGLARRLRDMSSLPASGEGWADRLLEHMALLHLLLKSYRRIDTLPAPTQADIRAAIGWTIREDEVCSDAGVSDTWLVLGQYRYDEDRLRVQRTWLRGQHTRQVALSLSFAHGDQPLDVTLMPGQAFEGAVCYYPGAVPSRAFVKTRTWALAQFPAPVGADADFSNLLSRYASAVAINPWLDAMGVVVENILPIQRNGRWFVRDVQGELLPVHARFTHPEHNLAWSFLALSGGRPVTLFGEWDGQAFLPLSVYTPGDSTNFVWFRIGHD